MSGLADVLAEWDNKIDAKLDDARGVHETVDRMYNDKYVVDEPGVAAPPADDDAVAGPTTESDQDGTVDVAIIIPPCASVSVLEVRAETGDVIGHRTVDPSPKPHVEKFQGLPSGPIAFCLLSVKRAKHVDLRPGKFKISL